MASAATPTKPKYIRLAERLRHEIASGQRPVGERLPGFGVAREQFDTTKNTLENAYALLEREGLVARVNGVGVFVSSPRPRTMTHMIGVVHLPSASRGHFPSEAHTSYEARLLQGIRGVLAGEGMDSLILDGRPSPGWSKIDGVLIHGHGAEVAAQLAPGLPRVAMMHPNTDLPCVYADDRLGARQATEHLLELGHRRIGCLLDCSPGNQLPQLRREGYRDALRAAGIAPNPRWEAPLLNLGLMVVRGSGSMQGWLDFGWREAGCTALLVQNDLAAIGAMNMLADAGLRVPQDVSVVGFDSTAECDLVRPRLTSVRVPLEDIGATAAGLLLRLLRGQIAAAPAPISIATSLQLRASTAPPGNTTSPGRSSRQRRVLI